MKGCGMKRAVDLGGAKPATSSDCSVALPTGFEMRDGSFRLKLGCVGRSVESDGENSWARLFFLPRKPLHVVRPRDGVVVG